MLHKTATIAISAIVAFASASTCAPETKPTKRPSLGCDTYLITDVAFHGNPDFTADIFFNSPDCKNTLYVTITQEEWNASTCFADQNKHWDACLKGE